METIKLVISILTITLFWLWRTRAYKKQIAQIKKASKKSQAIRKRKGNQKETILLGMKMKFLHQVKMKKPICV